MESLYCRAVVGGGPVLCIGMYWEKGLRDNA